MPWASFGTDARTAQWTQLSVQTQLQGIEEGLGPRLREEFAMILNRTYPILLASYYTTVNG